MLQFYISMLTMLVQVIYILFYLMMNNDEIHKYYIDYFDSITTDAFIFLTKDFTKEYYINDIYDESKLLPIKLNLNTVKICQLVFNNILNKKQTYFENLTLIIDKEFYALYECLFFST